MRDVRTRAAAARRNTARYVSALMNETSRILLIDDSAADIELAARLLRDTYANATLVAVTETATLADALSGARPDAVVLNPSKVGAHQRVVEWLAGSSARRVAYLSCDPRSLARDLEGLTQGSLKLVSVQPVDMMPQTNQVEALALLQRTTSGG